MKNTLKDKKVKSIVTDGFTGYNQIIEALKAKHQLCTFHIMHNLMVDLVKELNKIKRKIRTKKKKTAVLTENLEENRYKRNKKDKLKQLQLLKREIRILRKEKKEWEKYVERISAIFKVKTVKNAKIRFGFLFNSMGHLPPLIGNLIQKLSKVFDKTINHLVYDDVPSTNNKKERHYGVTLPGYLKKRFKTDLGLEMHLNFAEHRWNQRNKKNSNILDRTFYVTIQACKKHDQSYF